MIFEFNGGFTGEDREKFEIAQEEDIAKICEYLKVRASLLTDAIYRVFDTRKGKQKADPYHSVSRASARSSKKTLYRHWLPSEDPHFPHELTHLVAYNWSEPYDWEVELDTFDGKKIKRIHKMESTSFMQEGLAIAVDDIVFGRMLKEEGEEKYIDDWCRSQSKKIRGIELGSVINFAGFCSVENRIVVPFTASFSKYLLLNYGVAKYKKMYVSLKETSASEENVKQIERLYQQTEEELLKKWKLGLG